MSQDIENPEPGQEPPPKRPGPKLKLPVPPNVPDHDPEEGSPLRRLSTMVGINLLLLLTSLAAIGYVILLQYQPPPLAEKPAAPAEKSTVAGAPASADQVKTDVDQLRAEIKDLTKKLEARPASSDPTPQIKALDDKLAEVSKSVADMPARFDSISQKLEAASKGEGLASGPKVEAIEKRIGDIARTVDSLKADLSAKPAPTTATNPAPAAALVADAQALEPAIDQFKQGKFAEAKDAFTKLQSAFPDDARVWYYSALANGLATRDWRGESEHLVTTGMAREKAGTPDRAAIDAAFAELTKATGKDWLAFYRKRATQ
jgi:TolA-binding protein